MSTILNTPSRTDWYKSVITRRAVSGCVSGAVAFFSLAFCANTFAQSVEAVISSSSRVSGYTLTYRPSQNYGYIYLYLNDWIGSPPRLDTSSASEFEALVDVLQNSREVYYNFSSGDLTSGRTSPGPR